MPNFKRKIEEPLISDQVPKWKLTFLSSELYRNQQLPKLRERLQGALKGTGLHPLTKIASNCLTVADWILLSIVWREMMLGEMNKRTKGNYLDAELKQRILIQKQDNERHRKERQRQARRRAIIC